jgi:DNA-binding transcriptional ArsR family regulator
MADYRIPRSLQCSSVAAHRSNVSTVLETYRDRLSLKSGMTVEPDIAETGALFRDSSRAAMLTALLDRPVLSAGQLAFAANISPHAASFHLTRLTSAALLKGERQGRHQVYRLAGPKAANAIESLAAISPASRTLRNADSGFRSERMRQLRIARTCYNHLAGAVAVRFHNELIESGYLSASGEKQYALTRDGRRWFHALGLRAPDAIRIYRHRALRSHVRALIGANGGRISPDASARSFSISFSKTAGLFEYATQGLFGSRNVDAANGRCNTGCK